MRGPLGYGYTVGNGQTGAFALPPLAPFGPGLTQIDNERPEPFVAIERLIERLMTDTHLRLVGILQAQTA